MKRKFFIVMAILSALLALGGGLALAQASAPRNETRAPGGPAAVYRQTAYNTVITVTTAADPDDDPKYVCYSTDGMVGKQTRLPCSLRQAVEESDELPDTARPILIRFALPITESYGGAGDYWVIQLNTGQLNALPNLGEQTTLDGDTQTGGRSDGPKVIVRGPENVPEGYGLIMGSDSTVRGLAFQRLRMHVQINGNNNVVEDTWFGLSDDGQDTYLRDLEHPEDLGGQSGVSTAENNTNNRIQNNRLAGFRGAAISMRGDDSFVLTNTIGLRADGTLPEVRADRKCKPNAFASNWFGGAGMDVSGHNNRIEDNRIAAMLFRSEDPFSTPDNALDVSGHNHLLQNNVIGLTADGVPFGVCGEGLHVGGAMGAHYIQIRDNHIVGSQGVTGILIDGGPYGYDADAVTVQGNRIEDSAHEAFKFGDTLPAELRFFNPAAVTTFNGTQVSGGNGADSPCPGCTIELFLDQHDTVSETLQSLAVTTADANGDWSVTLARTLALTEGIRTASTTGSDGQIPHPSAPSYTYHVGTTSKLSGIYTQAGAPPPAQPPAATPLPPLELPSVSYQPPPTLPRTYVTDYTTVLTVTTAGDPYQVKTDVCYDTYNLPIYTPKSPCSLRRAVMESQVLAQAYRDGTIPNPFPILIRFDISTSDGYDAAGGYWTIQLADLGELNALPYMGDQTAIVGSTQPGGRSSGPKIVIRGPQNVPEGYGLVIDDDSYVSGLAFQRLRMHLQINGSGNIVEDNWFGLTADGQGIYLRDPEHPEDGSGQSGVTTAENISRNLIKDNVLTGFRGGAISLRSNDSFLRGNAIGVNADGVVPVDVAASRWCKPNARYYNWFGGAGVDVTGRRNQVGGPALEDGNIIVSMLIAGDSPFATPPTALYLSRQDHLVQNNLIGIDKAGHEVGVCGNGIVLESQHTRILSNTIARSAMVGLMSGGTRYNSNVRTWQGNIIKDSAQLFDFGPGIPEEMQIFTPTQVVTFAGNTVSGINGDERAACPYCRVELFLDDLDGVSETLQSMAVVTTSVDGTWSTTLPRPLLITEGLRTAVTSLNYGIIPNYDAGSSSRFSTVYSPSGAVTFTAPTPPLVPPPAIPSISYMPPPTAPYHYSPTFKTILTVTTAGDPYEVQSDICYDQYNLPVAQPKSPCSLRRAIEEAGKLADQKPEALPILIRFDIPITDNYDSAGGYWTIQLTDTGQLDALPNLGRQTVLDGDTQPGGRSDGPKIVIRGPESVPAGYGLKLYGDGNLVRGLAFQRLRMHMFIGGSGNIVEDNWFGLTSDGQGIYLRDLAYPEDGSGQSGIIVAENITNTLIKRNVLTGFRGGALSLDSNDSYLVDNFVGTNAEGIVPVDVTANRWCKPNARYDNWFGGAGVDVAGRRNQVTGNVIAGLLIRGEDPYATPPEALAIYGHDHLVQSNIIGVDKAGQEVGTCGAGLQLRSDFTRFVSNTIVRSGSIALYQAGTRYNSNARSLQGNVIRDSAALIEFDPGIPEAFQVFTPSQVTTINVAGNDTTVSGGNGDPNAACPYCQVELFLDDLDDRPETLESLAVASADQNGNWQVSLGRALALTEALRTASTPLDYGVIEDYYEAGSSSRFSTLYSQPGAPTPPVEPPPAWPAPPVVPPVIYTTPPTLPSAYVTTITVDTSSDSDTSSTKTCSSAGGGQCSLRFAINEVKGLAAAQRPALIAFNLLTTDSGYDPAGFWKISLNTNRDLPPVKGGQISIDGDTQPGGRSAGPKIILHRNSDSSTGDWLQMGETVGEYQDVVKGLALQGIGISLGDDGIAQGNWLGLSDDGTQLYFYNGNPDRPNYAVIKAASRNLITANALAGSETVAIQINGDDNLIEGNTIGTRADGTIDVASITPSVVCSPTATAGNWFGGGGLDLAGYRNRVLNNTIAGLLIEGSATSTPPNAIQLGFSEYSLIQGNRIGLDAQSAPVWTCGDGINNYGSAYTRILSNTIVNSYASGVFVEGRWWDSNANTLQGNVISNCIYAVRFGDLVPDELDLFSPALVTGINGTSVTGISDDDCPYCRVDVYLDDGDEWIEALEHLGATTADENGDWGLSLAAPLASGYGLRTISTARDYGVIKNYEAASSSKLSILFESHAPTALSGVQILTSTATMWADQDIYFIAHADPADATLPITYTWQATDLETQVVRGGVEKAIAFKWSSDGDKTVSVTAHNSAGGSVQDSIVVHVYKRYPLTGVSISGPAEGYAGLSYSFTAAPIPSNASEPITYTWSSDGLVSGQGQANAAYRWAATGTHIITLTAQNYANIVTGTHAIALDQAPSCIRVSQVELIRVGSGVIYTDTLVQFSAAIPGASMPYSYAVNYGDGYGAPASGSADPLTFDHTFPSVGDYTVEIAVWNCDMSQAEAAKASITLRVEAHGTTCVPVSGVSLSRVGSGQIYTDTSVQFSAAFAPTTLSRPYNYALDYGGGYGTPAIGSQSPLAFAYTFDTVGPHTVRIAVWNCAMTQAQAVSAATVVTVSPQAGPAITVTVEPGSGGRLDYTDPVKGVTTTILIPAGAVTRTTTFTYTPRGTPAYAYTGLRFAGRAFQLQASSPLAGSIAVSLSYLEQDLTQAGISNESDLRLLRWADSAWGDAADTCTPASHYTLDAEHNTLSVNLCQNSPFGLFGQEAGGSRVYMPLVLKAKTS